MLLPLALVSIASLALEIVLTKILSYSLSQMLVYLALGVALLGFGAAGSLVAVRAKWIAKEQIPKAAAWAALVFAISIIICYAIFTRLTILMNIAGLVAFVASFVLCVPFLAAGTVITLAIASSGTHLPRYYAVNLIGSGLGCFIPVLLLGPLSAQQLLVFLAILGWLSALVYLYIARFRLISALSLTTWATLALLIYASIRSETLISIFPEPPPYGQLTIVYVAARPFGFEMIKRFDRWNITGRIEIFEFNEILGDHKEPYPYMFYAQDSSAGSTLIRWDRSPIRDSSSNTRYKDSAVKTFCTKSLYGQGYFTKRPKVLIVGLGGAPDVQCAIYFGSQSIDVVEINQAAIAAVTGPFNGWLGDLNSYPGVQYHNADGRSFAHRTRGERFDLIQLSGVDTKQALASGGLTLSENYLYTKEAFVDYLKSLNPTGVVSIIRFGEREALRLSNTAVAALREIGVTNPANHIAVYQSGTLCGVIVGRSEFTQESNKRLVDNLKPSRDMPQGPFFYRFSYPDGYFLNLEYSPLYASNPVFSSFFEQVRKGDTSPFVESYPENIAPTVDDRPFFFDSSRYDRSTTWKESKHIWFLLTLILSVFVLSILLILLPVNRMRERLKGFDSVTLSTFFASVGLAYLLVEVWMLHRFSMFLGHQTYGLSVVLSTLLMSTGLGAAISPRIVPQLKSRVLVGSGLILFLLTSGAFVLPIVCEATWHLGLLPRVFVAMSFIVPTGIAMGFPFPAGLSWIHNIYPATVPWYIGINGFASVMATIIAIPLSLGFGYTTILVVGIGLYTFAALLFCFLRTRRAKPVMQRVDTETPITYPDASEQLASG